VQASPTMRTAQARVTWAGVSQMPSGMANTTARATAKIPARAVGTHRAVNIAQGGTAISRPMRIRCLPVSMSTVATTNKDEKAQSPGTC
jgi:hypothetical protein